MNILAINSSEKQAEISLYKDGKTYVDIMDEGKSHSEFLLKEIEDFLMKNSLTIQDIDYYSVNIGCGSFTGIRIAVSFVKAFMMALNKKTVTVNNFEILAYNIKENRPCYIVLNSNNSDLYCARLENNKFEYGYMSIIQMNEIVKSENINVYCYEKDKDIFNSINNLIPLTVSKYNFMEITQKKIECKEFVSIENLNPLYIKKSQAEQQLEEKINKNIEFVNKINIDEFVTLEKKCFKHPYSKNLLENDLKNDNRHLIFIKYFDEIIAYINFEVVIDEIELIKICVLEEFRGYDLASKLMEKMIEFKKQNSIKKIFLEVSSKNIPATKLYEKFNFRVQNIRKDYYEKNDDALIMVLE